MNLTSGSVLTNGASRKPGSVIEKMTVAIIQMRRALIVPAELVLQASLNVTMADASPRPGNVMWIMIVVITRMNHSMNAVSKTQLELLYHCCTS